MAMTARSCATMLRKLAQDFEEDPMTEAFTEVGALVREQVISNFSDEQDYAGVEWPPRKGNPPHLPLRETYAMYGAATVRSAPGSLEELGNKRIMLGVLGSTIGYAKSQQVGSLDGRLPARQYFYVRRYNQPLLVEPVRMAQRDIVISAVRRNQMRLGS